MHIRLCMALFVASLALNAFASEISIEMPQLTGDYEARPDVLPSFGLMSRHWTMTLPADLEHIDSMRFLISGLCTYGSQYCGFEEPPTRYTAEFVMSIFYSSSFLYCFMGSLRPLEGEFDDLSCELMFSGPGQPASLDCLLSRPIEIYLECIGFTYCTVASDFYGTLSDVRIVLNASVPVTSSTFSEIKTLFR
jgi:hypothetical protein